MFRYVEVVDCAETWRDPSQLQYSNEKYFSSLEEAKNYAKKENSFYFRSREDDFKYDEESHQYYFNCIGSWAPTLYIKECTIEK